MVPTILCTGRSFWNFDACVIATTLSHSTKRHIFTSPNSPVWLLGLHELYQYKTDIKVWEVIPNNYEVLWSVPKQTQQGSTCNFVTSVRTAEGTFCGTVTNDTFQWKFFLVNTMIYSKTNPTGHHHAVSLLLLGLLKELAVALLPTTRSNYLEGDMVCQHAVLHMLHLSRLVINYVCIDV